MPFQWLLLKLGSRWARRFPNWYHRRVAALFGLRIRVVGQPVTGEGVMWGIAGFLLGYGLLAAFLSFLTLPLRWRRGRPPHQRVPLLWRRRPRREVVIETVSLDQVAEARRGGRGVAPDRPIPPSEQTYAEAAVPAEQRLG